MIQLFTNLSILVQNAPACISKLYVNCVYLYVNCVHLYVNFARETLPRIVIISHKRISAVPFHIPFLLSGIVY